MVTNMICATQLAIWCKDNGDIKRLKINTGITAPCATPARVGQWRLIISRTVNIFSKADSTGKVSNS